MYRNILIYPHSELLSALHQQVRRTIRRHTLLPAGSRVLVALSGGSDSVALAALLRDLSRHGGFTVVGCAHVNHQLREQAGQDEAFCVDLAGRLELPIRVGRADVLTFAREHGVSIEEAARQLRYPFLLAAADDLGAQHVAVGHTRDDQAETFLLKLMRGASQTGLGGIYPRRDRIVRPLLDVSREDLRGWLRARGLSWVEDATNDDVGNPRNRVRLRVLPELAKALGGDPRPAIARAAGLLREDAEWLDSTAEATFELLADRQDEQVTLPLDRLGPLPGPIRSRVLRLALHELAAGREVTQEHVEAVRGLLEERSGPADVPGGRVELSREMLVLLKRRVWAK